MAFLAASAPTKIARPASRFSLYHGLALSLALHALLCAPYVLHRLYTTEEEASVLVFELDGLVDDEQTDEKLQQDNAGETHQTATQATVAKPVEQREQADEGEANAAAVAAAAASQSKPDPAGSANVAGAQEQQVARTISRRAETEEDRIRVYIRQLSKRIHTRLVYPEEGRRAGLRGVAKVSFGILASGQIREETLKIVATSGQERLDVSALKTVRSSMPFGPPPREMNVAIDVVFGPSR
ncbi:protein TonB [Methylosinus sp. sav-2]|uniref:energy transducer TonB n=1 Tax=Methylosinus sp. sav-2 TaxID=2485168 RepID=UPI00047961D2|nr:TonB family protein [Methylosinus sp. sav-2]TDX62824.1 protein TonB [Methylosinus sp. sav-2]